MKIGFVFLTLAFLIARKTLASECKVSDLKVETLKTVPIQNQGKVFLKGTKQWLSQETHPQEPAKTNFDTTVIALAPNDKIIRIFVEGHFRDPAVASKWIDNHTVSLAVERGHASFCTYQVDLLKAKTLAAK